MSDWTTSKLPDVIEIIGGGTPKRSEEKYWNGNIPWLSVADFNNDFRYVTNSSEHITELGLEKSSTKLLDKEYLIISARGTVGCLAQLSVPMAFNQSCYGLNGKDKIIDNGFLYYFLKNNISELKQKTHGAVFDTITRDTFEQIYISYPDIERQKEIANKLGDLDQKIQLNTQINQTLEQIAQGIFKSWFVDFDPVRAKADALAQGKTQTEAELAAQQIISGKTPEELTALSQTHPNQYAELAEIAKAFPSEFEEVEGFGEVPRGWKVKPLGNLISFVKGKKPKKVYPKKEENMLPHILISSLEGKYNEYCQIDKLITVKYQDIIMVMDGASSGRIAIGHDGIIGSTLAKLSIKDNKFWSIIYQFLKHKEKDIQFNTTGTTIPHTDKNRVNNYQTIIPSNFLLNKFSDFFENSLHQMIFNRKQTISLELTRDLLLPRLLRGEI